jgi:hypothetical protein
MWHYFCGKVHKVLRNEQLLIKFMEGFTFLARQFPLISAIFSNQVASGETEYRDAKVSTSL